MQIEIIVSISVLLQNLPLFIRERLQFFRLRNLQLQFSNSQLLMLSKNQIINCNIILFSRTSILNVSSRDEYMQKSIRNTEEDLFELGKCL